MVANVTDRASSEFKGDIKQSVKQFTFTQLYSNRFYEGQCKGKFSSLGRVAVSHAAQIPPQPDVETIAKAKPSVAADSS